MRKWNLWVYDNGWALASSMPNDGSGAHYLVSRMAYHDMLEEYKAEALMLLPADMTIEQVSDGAETVWLVDDRPTRHCG